LDIKINQEPHFSLYTITHGIVDNVIKVHTSEQSAAWKAWMW